MSVADDTPIGTMLKADLVKLIQDTIKLTLEAKLVEIITSLTTTITATVTTAMEEKMQDLENRLDSKCNGEIQAVRSDNTKLLNMNAEMQHRCDKLEDDVRNATLMANDVEQYGRRWSIRIHGLPVQVTPSSNDPTPAEAAAIRPSTRSTPARSTTSTNRRPASPREDCVAACIETVSMYSV